MWPMGVAAMQACRYGVRSTRLAAFCVLLLLLAPLAAGVRASPAPKVHQLRIYEIFEHNKAAFHDRFRDHAMRIMQKYDFKILSMWEAKSDARTEFVYLLEWPSEAVLKDRWAKFMADEEWAEIKRQSAAKYGAVVGEIQDRVLRATEYSPQLP